MCICDDGQGTMFEQSQVNNLIASHENKNTHVQFICYGDTSLHR